MLMPFSLLPASAYCLLPTAFCLLPSAFCLVAFSAPWFLYAGAGLTVVAVLVVLWLVFGPGPRRGRAYRRALRRLHQGAWQEALDAARRIGESGRLSLAWKGRLRNLDGECHRVAGDTALAEKRYEDCLKHYRRSAELLDLDPNDIRHRVVEAMMAEVRRLFAAGSGPEGSGQKAVGRQEGLPAAFCPLPSGPEPCLDLIARLLLIQEACPEAYFWQGLCHARAGRWELAQNALTTAAAGAKNFFDPHLYLGAVLLRQGRPQEALRHFSEANREAGGCPLVPWQLGQALLAAGGDGAMAVRALQRALGPRGLPTWAKKPRQFWVEAFPEASSYVRRLATKHPFACPLFGADVAGMARQAQTALARAQYLQGSFQEAADGYARLLQDSPPTPPLLQGLGMALARLERYDEAYKHLRIALDQEDPPRPLTAGYLALCGALGKPSRPEDKPKNVLWAVRLLGRFDVRGDAEWAGLAAAVFGEARALGLEVGAEGELRLADALVSVSAADPAAAAAYAHLAAAHPEALRPEHAWLYCRAAQQHGVQGEQELALFGALFRDEPAARAFYAQRGWDLDEVLATYLERCAARRPGRFPEELGADYPPRGEALLLERSRRQWDAGQKEAALATAAALHRLAPASVSALDWLARLHYRQGDLDRAAALLASWHALEPANPTPLVRRAVLEQQRGQAAARRAALTQALALTSGPRRAALALLGARLALAASGHSPPETNGHVPPEGGRQKAEGSPEPLPSAFCLLPSDLNEAAALLQECLRDDPGRPEALWQLAAVRAVQGDREGLAALASVMDRPDVNDARFHYLAAVCHLAAEAHRPALEACERAAADPALAVECLYLMGWAYLALDEADKAVAALAKVAAGKGPSADHARALLGTVRFRAGECDRAVQQWQSVAPEHRRAWQVDEALRGTAFLTGLEAYAAGRYEQAAERFREAGKLGLPERRLGPLITLALVKAGQRFFYEEK